MIIINFSHPLTPAQLARITELVEDTPEVRTVAVQIDQGQPLAAQATALIEQVGLTPDEWQTTPLLINLPGLAMATAALLAEIHGRTGGFCAVIRVRPIADSTPPQFEVAEIVNLQALRNAARQRRYTTEVR